MLFYCRLYKKITNTDVLKQVVQDESLAPDEILKLIADVGAEIYGLADLSLFTSLIDINLSRTEITSLNVEFAEQLIHIDISETNFTGELNLERNRQLKHLDAHSIDLDTLGIDQNQRLEYLNVSNTNLEALGTTNDEIHNRIKHLDISNTHIKQLDYPESHTYMALTYLNISNTPIRQLNLLTSSAY